MAATYFVTLITMWTAILIIALRQARTHHPFTHFGPANQITLVRALLVGVVAGFIGVPPLPRFALIAVAGAGAATVLDGVDGWIARRTGMTSAFGARFDMEIDALLIQVLALLVWRYGKAGLWVLASGLLRYVFVAAGTVLPWLRQPLIPSARGRAICVLQIVGLMVAMLPSIAPPASNAIAAISLAALFYSFVLDTSWLWRHRNA